MRVRITTTLTVAAAVIAGSALLTACNDDSGSSSDDTSSPSATAAATTAAPTTAAPTDSASAAGSTDAKGTAVSVNKSFTDDVMGDKGTVIKYVTGFQPSAASKSKFSALADEQVVLVNVTVTASSKYYDNLGATSFSLTGQSNGIDQASTTILDDDIKAAGYPPLEDAETGKTTTGWIVFTPKKDEKTLILRYKRLAANASDGTKITAKNFDIPLN
ncbi:MAG: DUF4352 domain-containing protein [Streptomyces sp.]|nr:DUF4352 domain-containing protein [Streptomyces sp.]